jgi:hypothetical protein
MRIKTLYFSLLLNYFILCIPKDHKGELVARRGVDRLASVV